MVEFFQYIVNYLLTFNSFAMLSMKTENYYWQKRTQQKEGRFHFLKKTKIAFMLSSFF